MKLLFIGFILISFCCKSQISFENYFSTSGATAVNQTFDGGYVITGAIYEPYPNANFYLTKVDSLGDLVWRKSYGGIDQDFAMDVQQTIDSGFIMVGSTSSSWMESRVFIVKTDISGDTLWTRIFGGASGDQGKSVEQTNDGGYILVGKIESADLAHNIGVIKLNTNGDTLWTKAIFGLYGNCIEQTSDNGFIITGKSNDNTNSTLCLVKLDSIGNSIWTKSFGGQNSDGKAVKETLDSGYIVSSNSLLIKTDVNGNEIWSKSINGNDVIQTTDGGYALTAASGYDIHLTKTDSIGNIVWVRKFHKQGWCGGNSLQQTTDNGFIIGGYNSSDYCCLIKTNESGCLNHIFDAGNDTIICSGENITLNAIGGVNYNWTPSVGLSDVTDANPIASPLNYLYSGN